MPGARGAWLACCREPGPGQKPTATTAVAHHTDMHAAAIGSATALAVPGSTHGRALKVNTLMLSVCVAVCTGIHGYVHTGADPVQHECVALVLATVLASTPVALDPGVFLWIKGWLGLLRGSMLLGGRASLDAPALLLPSVTPISKLMDSPLIHPGTHGDDHRGSFRFARGLPFTLVLHDRW